MRLEGEVALVTGSTRGIGRATAQRFAREGAAVVITGRTEDLGTALERELRDTGGEAVFVAADLAKEEQVEHLIGETVRRYGRLSVLVNNAAPTEVIPVEDGSVVDVAATGWRKILDLTLSSAFLTCKYALAQLAKEESSSIINISSGVTIRAMPGQVAYTSAKAGLEGMTRALAVHHAADGVRANTIVVGFVPHGPLLDMLAIPAFEAAMKKGHLTRLGTPDDIANAALFLASHESDFVTGATLVVDGGASCFVPMPELSADMLSDEAKEDLFGRG